jgi:2-dehydropantoate 2-reductase
VHADVRGDGLRVAVIGAGAMGSIVGAALIDGGVDTHFVDVSPALIGQLSDKGLRIRRGEQERVLAVHATGDPSEIGPVDAVLFFVKCYHTEAAAELATPLVGPATAVVSLQNGWGNGDVLASHFSAEQLVVGITYHSGTVLDVGLVNHSNVNDAPTFIGPFVGDDLTATERLAAALRAGGMTVTATSAIRTEIWKKLVLNAGTLATSALTRFTAGALGADAAMHELVDELAREAVAAGRAQGYHVDADERIASIAKILEGAGAGKASMLQDIEANRQTEIAVINEAVVRVADAHGIPVPLNRAMVALVRGYERANSIA